MNLLLHPTLSRIGLLSAAVLLAVGAASLKPTRASALPAGVWGDRARIVGVEPTVATALWMRAMQRFGAASLQPEPEHQLERSGPLLAEDLGTSTALDPSFDDPWLGGTLMLRVCDQDAALRAHIATGQEQRADLPWHLLTAGGVE